MFFKSRDLCNCCTCCNVGSECILELLNIKLNTIKIGWVGVRLCNYVLGYVILNYCFHKKFSKYFLYLFPIYNKNISYFIRLRLSLVKFGTMYKNVHILKLLNHAQSESSPFITWSLKKNFTYSYQSRLCVLNLHKGIVTKLRSTKTKKKRHFNVYFEFLTVAYT